MRLESKKVKFAGDHGENGHSSDEVLASIGVAAKDVDAIILTHLHWDHASGLTCFPNAHVYVQKQEFFKWIEAWSKPACFGALRTNTDPEDLKALIDCAVQGRLTLLDGDCDNILGGVHVRLAPMVHSFALQAVLIDTAAGTYIMAADICMRPENLTGTAEAPGFYPNVKFSVGSSYEQALFYEKLLEWADGDVSRIIMTHDGTRISRYRTEESILGLRHSYIL